MHAEHDVNHLMGYLRDRRVSDSGPRKWNIASIKPFADYSQVDCCDRRFGNLDCM